MNYSITTRTRRNSIVEKIRARAHHSRYKAPSYLRSHDVCYVGKGSWWNTAGPGKEGTHEVQYPSRSAVSQQNASFLTPRMQKTPPPRRPVRNDPRKPMPSFLHFKWRNHKAQTSTSILLSSSPLISNHSAGRPSLSSSWFFCPPVSLSMHGSLVPCTVLLWLYGFTSVCFPRWR